MRWTTDKVIEEYNNYMNKGAVIQGSAREVMMIAMINVKISQLHSMYTN